jgi:hypothetical protein
MANALDRAQWNRVKAARMLRISYRTMLTKIMELGLVAPGAEKKLQAIIR